MRRTSWRCSGPRATERWRSCWARRRSPRVSPWSNAKRMTPASRRRRRSSIATRSRQGAPPPRRSARNSQRSWTRRTSSSRLSATRRSWVNGSYGLGYQHHSTLVKTLAADDATRQVIANLVVSLGLNLLTGGIGELLEGAKVLSNSAASGSTRSRTVPLAYPARPTYRSRRSTRTPIQPSRS